jgi:hypothetical protein
MDTIFLVAVIHEESKRGRTWGWYQKFEDAERAVLENHTDIFERSYYDLGVIEEMPEGVLAVAEKVWWYRATYPTHSVDPEVERIECPATFKQQFGFTMG